MDTTLQIQEMYLKLHHQIWGYFLPVLVTI